MADFDIGSLASEFAGSFGSGETDFMRSVAEVPSYSGGGDYSGLARSVSGTLSPGTFSLGFDPRMDAGGGGGGGTDWLGTISKYATPALDIAKLGLAGMGVYQGINAGSQASAANERATKAQEFTQQAAAPAAAAAGQLIPAGTTALMTGQLPPPLEMKAQEFEQKLRSQYRDLAARMGLNVSTTEAEFEDYVKQQVNDYRVQLAQGLLQGGTSATGAALSGASSLGSQATAQGQDLSSAMANANQQMYRLLGSA